MAEQYRFFDHVDGDRVYNADEFAEYFRQVLTSGVLNGGTNLQVYCNGTDRIARIKPGKAWLEGYFYKNTEELELQLDEAHGTYDRIDRIVLRLDRNPENRYIKAFVKTGIPSMSPVPPALIREGLVYEISLAQILVVHNTTVIPVNKVTDERLNASVCGLVNSLIQVDTTTMQAEFDAFMAYLQTQGYVPQVDFLNHLNTADPHSQYALKETLNEHLEDGAQHAKTARFVIGTSTAGWTAKDCDYLCDGTADQIEINNAITALSASGGEIIILNGTYNITAKINVNKDNVSIKGNGNATILKRMWNSSSAEGVITLTSVEGCRVQNLQVDGNKANYASTNNYGIHLDSSSNNTVISNTCDNSSVGIYLNSSSNNTVIGNICNNNTNNGIHLDSSSNENTVTGNTCNNNNYCIYLNSSSSNNTVTGNTCNNSDVGIRLNASSNNTVTGNTCNNNSYCIYLNSSSNNTVTGNTCNNSVVGIRLNVSNNNTVTGNTCIRGTGQTSDYTSSQYTILLASSYNNYNLISSNNCMGKEVVISGGTGNSAWGNKFDATDDLP